MRNIEYKLRREKLLKKIGGNSAVIIFAAKELVRSGDVNYPYRQDSDFYYLTGWVEASSIAVLVPGIGDGEFVLFSREHDPEKEIWNGEYIGQEKACRLFGADRAFSMAEIDKILPQLLVGKKNIYFNLGFDYEFAQKIKFWANQAEEIGSTGPNHYELINLNTVLHEERLRKDQAELVSMRAAAEITVSGHLRAMQSCKPGMYEFELEAELLYEFRRLGGACQAFAPIVAGGANCCTLHYAKNDGKLSAGELVLVDAGAEYKNYCADISRTYPINGIFSQEQRAIYEIVLAAQHEIIRAVRPGVAWHVLQGIAERVITEGLVGLGLLDGNVDDLLAKESFKPFFMHRFGHWLGLDVHDVGGYMVDGMWRALESGMVLTVEPGIYVGGKGVVDVDNKWCGIGVRIEDNILVTDNGFEVLTASLPKSVADIEHAMSNRG